MIEFYGSDYVGNMLLLWETQISIRARAMGDEASKEVTPEHKKYLDSLVHEMEHRLDALKMDQAGLAARVLRGALLDHFPSCNYASLYASLEGFLSQLSLEFSKQRFAFR